MTHWPPVIVLFTLFVISCDSGRPTETVLRDFAADRLEAWPQHSHFPLTPGTVRVYEGDEQGQLLREEISIGAEPEVLWGTLCAVMTEHRYLDDELTEVSSSWYGLDMDGNIWKFGEESLERRGDQFVRSADSWVVGSSGALPSIAFAAHPTVGDVYVTNKPDGTHDSYQVVSVDATATLSSGTFENCLQVVENPDEPDDQDIILYAPGMGKVSERGTSGHLELVTTGREGPGISLPTPRATTPIGTSSSRGR